MAPRDGKSSRGLPQEVGSLKRGSVSNTRPATTASERIGFVTGKLAAPALEQTLEMLAPEVGFEYEVVRLNIAVAALMTTEWIARRLDASSVRAARVGRWILPGYVRGALEPLEKATGARFERGPRDLRVLPEYFGRESTRSDDYGEFDVEIIAEINHVPQLPPKQILGEARRLAKQGADIIDLGCDPGGPFTEIGDRVALLKAAGLRVSVDSLDPREIRPAVAAGAELVLSVNSTNLDVAKNLGCEVVVIPDQPSSLQGLAKSIEQLRRWQVPYRIDPVIEPIGFGFARSLGRYLTVRDQFPDDEIMMGIGNLTELTDADSAPINVMLLGFCQEIGIRSVLTTQVIHWARSSVEEVDLARRLVHFAVSRRALPKHLEPELHVLRDPALHEYGEAAFEKLAADIKDRNFRLFAERGEIHVVSTGLHLKGADPFDLFEAMKVTDPQHAFYLGYEMSKAVTALTLGKVYTQDEALRWGFLTREEESYVDKLRRRGSIEAKSGDEDGNGNGNDE